MDNHRSGTTTTTAVLSFVIGLLSIVEYGHAASVKTKDDVFNINITMPNFNTTQVGSIAERVNGRSILISSLQEDQYTFLQYELPDEELAIGKSSTSPVTLTISIHDLVGYTPLIHMNAAHHMLTFACAAPGSDRQTWFVLFTFMSRSCHRIHA